MNSFIGKKSFVKNVGFHNLFFINQMFNFEDFALCIWESPSCFLEGFFDIAKLFYKLSNSFAICFSHFYCIYNPAEISGKFS